MTLSITVPGTCAAVFVICTAVKVAVEVSGALLKVKLLLGGSTVSTRVFLFASKSLVLALLFL